MPEAFLKRDSNTGIFPVKFAKFLRAPILKCICEPLLLYLQAILLTIHGKDTANEAQLESSETYMMEFFCENSQLSLALNDFHKNFHHGSKYASEPQTYMNYYNTDDNKD